MAAGCEESVIEIDLVAVGGRLVAHRIDEHAACGIEESMPRPNGWVDSRSGADAQDSLRPLNGTNRVPARKPSTLVPSSSCKLSAQSGVSAPLNEFRFGALNVMCRS